MRAETFPASCWWTPAAKVISDTYAGQKYVGPEKVLADLDAILAKTPAAAIAATR